MLNKTVPGSVLDTCFSQLTPSAEVNDLVGYLGINDQKWQLIYSSYSDNGITFQDPGNPNVEFPKEFHYDFTDSSGKAARALLNTYVVKSTMDSTL